MALAPVDYWQFISLFSQLGKIQAIRHTVCIQTSTTELKINCEIFSMIENNEQVGVPAHRLFNLSNSIGWIDLIRNGRFVNFQDIDTIPQYS